MFAKKKKEAFFDKIFNATTKSREVVNGKLRSIFSIFNIQ